jgi:hypothetical protein
MRSMAVFARWDLPLTYRRVWPIWEWRRISMIVGRSTPSSFRIEPAVWRLPSWWRRSPMPASSSSS